MTTEHAQPAPILPVTMVGSYPRPLWFRQQLHGQDVRSAFKLEEHAQAYEDATAAVIHEQEQAGLDIVTDGQMYFDDYGGSIGSFVWYWYERIPGFYPNKMRNPLTTSGRATGKNFDLFNNWGGTTTTGPIGRGTAHLADLYLIASQHATRPLKVSVGAGPINLGFHVHYDLPESHYRDPKALTEDLVPVFNAELRELVDAGATFLQLEDLGAWFPLMSGDDGDAAWVVDVVNRTIEGVEARIGWHFCLGAAYGNSNQSVFGGHLGRILPPLYDTRVDEFVLDFALRGMVDVEVLGTLPKDKSVAAGVIDVRAVEIESDEVVADRMRRVLEVLPARQVSFTTDCGMRVLPRLVAREKLRAMARAAQTVRQEVGGAVPAGSG
jgi:5-methyltetrahydropteroyltriglutamate--homocysteine methyltransferase